MSIQGHLILDEDLERTTFIVGTGLIAPMDIVSISISTTLELPTLENGAIRIIYPTLLTPIVTGQMTSSKTENSGKSEENGCVRNSAASSLSEVKTEHCVSFSSDPPAASVPPWGNKSGPWPRSSSVPIPSSPAQQPTWRRMSSTSSCWSGGLACWLVLLFPPFPPINSLIPLLTPSKLASGLESPTHALRADADPSAQSASATYITLAQEHPYDRHIEIILHLSGEKLGTFSSLIYADLVSSMLYYDPQKLTAHWSY